MADGPDLTFRIDAADRLEALARARAKRGALLMGLGLFGVVVGVFWMIWGVVLVLLSDMTLIGVAVSLVGLGPATGSAIVAFLGLARRDDALLVRRLRLIAAGHDGQVTTNEVTRWTGVPAKDFARLAQRLATAGALVPVQSPTGDLMRSPELGGAPLAEFRRARHRRMLWIALAAVAMVGFASFWLVVAIYGMAEGDWAPALVLAAIACFPLSGSAALAYRAAGHRRRAARAADLVVAIASCELLTLDDLARAMEVSPADARATAIEAMTLGAVPQPEVLRLLEPGKARPAAPRREISWVGRTLKGSWIVEAPLAQGGMGAIYRARHVRTGRPYAVKVLLSGDLDPDAIRRFEREATAAGSLGHSGIVAVHDFAEEEGGAYMVMDLLEGETLEARLQRDGTLPWPEARRVILEVGDALACAHEAGLLHRDIKPANIFLAKSGGAERAVLLDFGLVKAIDDAVVSRITSSGVVAGTPLYMSPEQARGDVLDVRSDLYALAVVLFEIVAGIPPFFDRTAAEVYARLLREAAPRLGDAAAGPYPAALDDILSRALAKDPRERQASVRELLAAIAPLTEPDRALAG
jgi:hypothetical protein